MSVQPGARGCGARSSTASVTSRWPARRSSATSSRRTPTTTSCAGSFTPSSGSAVPGRSSRSPRRALDRGRARAGAVRYNPRVSRRARGLGESRPAPRGRDAAMTTLARAAALGALLLAFLPAFGQQPAGKARALPTEAKEWKGDFDGMIEHRHVRVLVPYSRTLYFNDKGRERGITADFVRDFERYINTKYAKQLGKRPITVYIVPTTRDELFKDVVAGLGDIAAGNLTVTEERKRLVDFFAPGDFKVSEIVVTGPKSPSIATTDDLAGKTVHVRMASSYYQSLVALNERFKKEGKPAVKLTLVPEALEDEDMMEMLNAGVLEAIVVDDWKAKMWAAILPKIKVNDQAVVHAGGTVGWAFRKGSPKLQEILQDFYASYVKKQNLVQARLKQYQGRLKQIKDPTGSA